MDTIEIADATLHAELEQTRIEREAYYAAFQEQFARAERAEARVTRLRDAAAACLEVGATLDRTIAERDALQAEHEEREQELLIDLADAQQRSDIIKRENARLRSVTQMHERTIVRLEQRHAAGGTAARRTDDDADVTQLVSVDPVLLAHLVRETCATKELRTKYQQLMSLLDDPRLVAGDKVATAIIWDIAGPTRRRVTAQAVAARAGLHAKTCTGKMHDLDAIGLIDLESRHVLRTRAGVDENRQQYSYEREEIDFWIERGRLPAAQLKKEDIKALASKRSADRKRKRCRNCGSERLQPATFVCLDCSEHMSDADATRAGVDIIVRADGRRLDRRTGEVLPLVDPTSSLSLPAGPPPC